MKAGVFFGSFDPPHIGHTNVIVGALNSGKVDRVLVVPAYQNVWKHSTPFKHRYVMAHQAFGNITDVFVSDIEKTMTERAYGHKYDKGVPTCDVLVALTENFKQYQEPVEMVIITTPETYAEIPNWQNGEEILNKYKFLLVISSTNEIPSRDVLLSVDNCYIPGIKMCSTCIRNRIKDKVRVEPFVVDDVIDHIEKYNLYA